MLSSDGRISSLYGVSVTREKLFAKLGIHTIYDLVMHFPRGYDSRGQITNVCDLIPGSTMSCIVTVGTRVTNNRIPSKNGTRAMTVQKFTAYDETGSIRCTFFNRDYLGNSLPVGTKIRIHGKVGGGFTLPEFTSPTLEPLNSKKPLLDFVPKYPLVTGLTDNIIVSAIRQCIEIFKDKKFDIVSEEQRNKYNLITFYEALCNIHFPESFEMIEKARRRLAFDELLLFQMNLLSLGKENSKFTSLPIKTTDISPFVSSLGFSLTQGQMIAIADILADMRNGNRPMGRLIQGDVGCGKTVVAAAAVYACTKSGHQAALMAPTAILATQHYNSLCPLMERHGIKTALLTGSTTQGKKKEILMSLSSGEIDFIIGTHSLIENNVEFSSLALVITDEQHRFGVRQREKLENKISIEGNTLDNCRAHMLVMSATPIPRTLALILYGDLDVTLIRDMPNGRIPVETFAVGQDFRERLNRFIEKHISENSQVYIVCPLVKDPEEADELKSEKDALKSVENYYLTVKKRFPSFSVDFIHGKLKNSEKDKIMERFSSGETDILVSTTVIEVGVNVPNATLMIVEDAERFGLSQLHQLRGRVGRGNKKSYCVLISSAIEGDVRKSNSTSNAAKRLSVLCNSSSGFDVAEKDLEIRGPGEFFGERQHGEMKFKIADIAADMDIIEMTRELAKKIVK